MRLRAYKFPVIAALLLITACTLNPATGERQFTLFMSPAQEEKIGAAEHDKIMQLFGGSVKDQKVIEYVRQIGQRLVPGTERENVSYKFYVLDSPVINAFALPGGYVYVSRGLVTLANNEAQLASVIAHEIAHITARHSAERYSQSVLASLGTSVLASSVDMSAAGNLAQLGSRLYLSSYSRDQESEADELGIRYLVRGGYDPLAASQFLESLDRHSALETLQKGKDGRGGFDFFSTHPKTQNRVREAYKIGLQYKGPKKREKEDAGRDRFLNIIEGMVFGHSAAHGFARDGRFIHPELGFQFEIPLGFQVINNPSEVIVISEDKGAIIFDNDQIKAQPSPDFYLANIWMKDNALSNLEKIEINGRPAATASFPGTVRGQRVIIRLVAVEWTPGLYYRFMMAIPGRADQELLNIYKQTTYSLESVASDTAPQPRRIQVVSARKGEDINDMAAKMAIEEYRLRWFRVLNGLSPSENIREGERYKIISVPH